MKLQINYGETPITDIEDGKVILATKEKYLDNNINCQLNDVPTFYNRSICTQVPIPASTVTRYYNGEPQTNGYEVPTGVIKTSGIDIATEVGNYTAYYSPQDGYIWVDGTAENKPIIMSIVSTILNTFSIPDDAASFTIQYNQT